MKFRDRDKTPRKAYDAGAREKEGKQADSHAPKQWKPRVPLTGTPVLLVVPCPLEVGPGVVFAVTLGRDNL